MISHCSLYGIIYVLFFEFFLNVVVGDGYDVASSQDRRRYCMGFVSSFFVGGVCVYFKNKHRQK